MTSKHLSRIALLLGTVALTACTGSNPDDAGMAKRVQALEEKVSTLSATKGPDLGETMQHLHIRQQRLGSAIDSQSWDLAEYLVDEIEDGLKEAGSAHPKARAIADVPQAVTMFIDAPAHDLDGAIKRHDLAAANAAYERLSAGCTGCHAAAGIGFNVIRPSSGSAKTAALDPR